MPARYLREPWMWGFSMRSRLAIALLVLAGCLPEGRPLEEYLADKGVMIDDDGGIVEVPDAAPDALAPVLCTEGSGANKSVTFETTQPDRNIDLYWVAQDCRERYFATIGPQAATWNVATFVEHVWRGRYRSTQELVFEIKIEEDTPEPLQVP